MDRKEAQMSYARRIAAITGLVAALTLAAVAVALTGDPFRSVELTPSEAATHAAAFVGSPSLVAADLTVNGPNDGAFERFYDVSGPRMSATVDAHTGSIITLYMGSATGVGAAVVDADAARSTAEKFLADRSISVAGLDESVRFADHGESAEYVVEWDRLMNGVIVPDNRVVGVDVSTGQVFRYASVQRPFDPPPTPAIDRPGAIGAALKSVGLSDRAQTDKTELRVTFTATGVQKLVWDIYLTDIVDTTASGQAIPGHWVVEVDAMSGSTSLIATS
jgi:hypothetical protein